MSAGTTRSTRSPATCTSNGISPAGKIFYTTGRLTSEMVIKTVQMGIPILISRSGFTAWGVELARQAGLTLIGRAKGRRFVALAGAERIVFDGDPRGGRATSRRGSRARRASPRTDAGCERSSACCWPADSRAAWAAATRRCARSAGATLLDHVIDRMRPQVAALVLNANGDPARFAGFGLPVVADSVADFAGPLAGMLAGLDWAAANRPGLP